MLKCSKEAFAACSDRIGCGCPEEATFTEGSECDMFNRQIGSHTMTHADQIRAMSDEELSSMLREKHIPCDYRTNDECRLSYCGCCEVCTMDWLQQPAEVSCDGN